jgi:hypothetical protein
VCGPLTVFTIRHGIWFQQCGWSKPGLVVGRKNNVVSFQHAPYDAVFYWRCETSQRYVSFPLSTLIARRYSEALNP